MDGNSDEAKYVQGLLELNRELQALTQSLVPRMFRFDIGGDSELAQTIAVFALTKATKTHAATLALCRSGYGEDASVLVRSLFELALDMLYLGQNDTGVLARRYVDHDWVIRYQMLQVARADPGLEPSRLVGEFDNLPESVIDREAHRVQERWHFWERETNSGQLQRPKSHWSGKSIRQVAADVGWESHYNTMYRLVSQLAHSSVRGANQYMRITDVDTVELNSGPSDNYVRQALFSGFVYLHQIAQFWRAEMRPDDLQLERELARLDQSVVQLFKAYR